MRDGLYQVTRGPVCAGFTIGNGQVGMCAPILRKRGMAGRIRRVDTFHRILLTGSRDFTDRSAVRRDLLAVQSKWGCRPEQIVVVHGAARGLDTIAGQVATELGMRVESHPVTSADWDRYGKSAGHRRNAAMIASVTRRRAAGRGVIAYPVGESRGTRGCMAASAAAGLTVWNRTDALSRLP